MLVLSRRVRAARAWFWLFALAQATRAQARVGDTYADYVSAHCAPAAGDRCRSTASPTVFIVNGQEFVLHYNAFHFDASCAPAQLDDDAWPRFHRSERFFAVALAGCAPPANMSYAKALRKLKVAPVKELWLIDIPNGAQLTADALGGLPSGLELLGLWARDALEVAPGTLAIFDVVALNMSRVRADHLPPFLDRLELRDTGARELPSEALNVIELTVHEPNLTVLAGAAPRLEALALHAPVEVLPAAPLLTRLTLADAAPARLPAGYVEGSPALAALVLRNFTLDALPPGLLRDAAQLTTFSATHCRLRALPPDLFAYSPQLREIDLSDNLLEAVPSEIFSGLDNLTKLTMKRNLLTAAAVGAITPVASLVELRLSGNPLGDLCSPGDLSPLYVMQQLNLLELEATGATRTCTDYLRRPTILVDVRLADNAIQQFSCGELRVPFQPYYFAQQLDLSRNPLTRVVCSRLDYELASADRKKGVQSSFITMDSRLKCDCDGYWLARMLRERRVEVGFSPSFENDPCVDEWAPCRPAEERESVKFNSDICGLLKPAGEALIIGGRVAQRGELPWHAAVYKKNKKGRYIQTCGGSLVSTKIVISAAHCFWSDLRKQLPEGVFAVALGKFYRRWDDPRDEDVHKSEVSRIELPKRFLGNANNFQSDIALLTLAETVEYRPHIAPICVDFNFYDEERQLRVGNYGKVAGWGLTAVDGKHSEVLKVVELPYVAIDDCQSDAPAEFKQYITGDKMCAGYRNGTAALCRGNSGGGLAFPDALATRLRYFLRGVVSTAPSRGKSCNADWLTTFTLISKHSKFILGIGDP